ncbi:MAG: hypothetical protein QOE19_3272, partial [Actinomycetota bacterium]|nr:hypothetical protein [Actinomycetota bacterium]
MTQQQQYLPTPRRGDDRDEPSAPAATAEDLDPVDHLDHEVGTPDLVRLYLDEIGRAPLLDAASEVELARSIEAGLFARHLLDELG